MNFDVVLSITAENELVSLWNNPILGPLIATAVRILNARLERNATNEGESRTQNTRITFEFPLGMLFWVNEESRRVVVLHVWAFRRR
ncbi:MAG TPA: hypothetical protein VG122_21140 [Gemmata sp.]|jgi:hypothetical protein|nr:hypothetical protein [Gemmata sp.]